MNGRKGTIYALAMTMAAVLIATGCPTESDPKEKPGPDPVLVPETRMFIGPSLTLAGQVRLFDTGTEKPVKFEGNRNVSFRSLESVNLGGFGNIVDGHLKFKIDVPASTAFSPTRPLPPALVPMAKVFDGYDSMYEDFSMEPSNAKGVAMRSLTTSGGGMSGFMHRMAARTEGTTETLDEVFYVYVNADVAIKGYGMTVSGEGGSSSTEGVNISLKTGWNVIHLSSATFHSQDGTTAGQTVKMSAANPDWVGWVLRESGDTIEFK